MLGCHPKAKVRNTLGIKPLGIGFLRTHTLLPSEFLEENPAANPKCVVQGKCQTDVEQAFSTPVSFRFFAAVVCAERDRGIVGKRLITKTVSPPLNATCPELSGALWRHVA